MTKDQELANFLTALAAPLVAGEIFDQIPDTVFFLKDRQGRYLAVNNTLVERCGKRNKAELLGRTVVEVFPTALAQGYAAQDRHVLETGRPIMGKLELHLFPNHKAGWCVTTKLPLRNTDGRVIGIAGVSRDVHGAGRGQAVPPALVAVVDYLAENFAEPISVENLAHRAKLSNARFSRLVKRIYQLTPTQLIMQMRLQAATKLLRETAQPIGEIAHACGFYDHATFSRQFRSTTGMTPLSYRDSSRS